RHFVLEINPYVSRTIAFGISTLDHEVGNHAMKTRSVVERHAMLRGSTDGILPVLGAGGEADEVLDSDRSFVGEQSTSQISNRGLDDGRRFTRCGGMVNRSLGRSAWFGRRCGLGARLRANHQRSHRK